MAKKVYAVTNIKVAHDRTFAAGEELDQAEVKSFLNMDQIKALFDNGALEVRDVADEDSATVEEETNPEAENHGNPPKNSEE